MRLFGFERSWAAAAFDAVFPDGTALPHGIARMNPGRYFAETIQGSPLEQAVGLRLTLWIVALAPLWVLGRPRTIAGLGPEDRGRVLERLLTSPAYAIRQLMLGFKSVAAILYATSPEIRAAMTTPRIAPALTPLRTRPRTPAIQGTSHEHAAG